MITFHRNSIQPTSPQAELKRNAGTELTTETDSRQHQAAHERIASRTSPFAAFPPVLAGIRASKHERLTFPCDCTVV